MEGEPVAAAEARKEVLSFVGFDGDSEREQILLKHEGFKERAVKEECGNVLGSAISSDEIEALVETPSVNLRKCTSFRRCRSRISDRAQFG